MISSKKILNIGCGTRKIPGMDNLDCSRIVNPDILFDLEWCEFEETSVGRIPVADNTYDELHASHVLEHVRKILPAMQELHRVAKPGALLLCRVPYGACSIAFEDPTHVRQMFPKSFQYFGQMMYNAADYGYRGDWEVRECVVIVRDKFRTMPFEELAEYIECAFNVVEELLITLECIKPIRRADGVPQVLPMKVAFREDLEKQLIANQATIIMEPGNA